MNKPLLPDERAELDFLRNAVPVVEGAVLNLKFALDRLERRYDAGKVLEARIEIELRQIRDQIVRAIEYLDSGQADKAKTALKALLILEKK